MRYISLTRRVEFCNINVLLFFVKGVDFFEAIGGFHSLIVL